MDDLPPRPLVARTSRNRQHVPGPRPRSNPLGGMFGSLAAGAWCVLIAFLFSQFQAVFWIAGSLGFFLIGLGFLLLGVNLGDALDRRRHPHG